MEDETIDRRDASADRSSSFSSPSSRSGRSQQQQQQRPRDALDAFLVRERTEQMDFYFGSVSSVFTPFVFFCLL